MNKRIALVLSVLTLSLLPATSVKAESGQMHIFEPCSMSPVAPCIESLSVVDELGKSHIGILTGKKAPTTLDFAQQKFTGTDYEWDVPGIIQPGGNSTLQLSGMYFPLNTPYCWLPNQDIKNCDYSVDEMTLRVLPSPFEPTKSRDLDKNYKYQITLKLPDNFSPAMLAAEGATGEISVMKNSDGTRSMLLVGQPTEVVFGQYNTEKPLGATTLLGFYLQSNRSLQATWTNVCNEDNLVSYWHNTGVGTTPVWSKTDGTIEMQTEGFHLKPDGTLNQGLIELQVPVKMAKCLWGVDLSHAVSASISATYTDGTAAQIISTKTVVHNDYFVLSSYGFHYSAPLLKVKMQQDITGGSETIAVPINTPTTVSPTPTPTPTVSPTPTPTPTVSPTPTPTLQPVTQAQKKITITCIKNKMTKMVTGVKPVCPAGYKKK